MKGSGLRGRRGALALLSVGLIGTAGLAGCSGGTVSSGGIGYVDPETTITRFQTAERGEAPRLSGSTTTGSSYTTSYLGHVTVINIWGSWCTQCREEAPSFAEAAKDYASKNVRFVGVDTLDNDSSANAYLSRYGISYPALADPEEKLVLDLKSIVPAEGIPSTLIVDEDGKVAVRAIGAITEPELDQQLDYVLTAG
ncbi:TlpA family protein disulfide reductase [Actinospica robiniae]|uniref:TlpA family protein disulfide reductase n=1 Tax=Actinospica robiniae TaxID=304901 RepID=UPI000416A458|nr:TlpA disulfide reductase family protein [Actinospica robiniae]